MDTLSTLRFWLWDVEPIRYYASSTVVALAVVLLPRFIVKAIGNCTWGSRYVVWALKHLPAAWTEDFGPPLIFSANMVGFWRFLIFIAGDILFHINHPVAQFIGVMLIALALALDRLDGRIAEVCGQKTLFGQWWDPLLDKLTLSLLSVDMIITCMLAPAIKQLVSPLVNGNLLLAALALPQMIIILLILGTLITAEVVGTLGRPPFNRWKERCITIGATGFGKMKFLTMAVYCMITLPVRMGWFQTPSWGIYTFLLMSDALALLSVASRYRYEREWINQFVAATTKPFRHTKRNNVLFVFGHLLREALRRIYRFFGARISFVRKRQRPSLPATGIAAPNGIYPPPGAITTAQSPENHNPSV